MNSLSPQIHAIASVYTPGIVLAFGCVQAESLWVESRAPWQRWREARPAPRTDWTPLPRPKRSDWR
jgi:hypothetical protein